MKHIIVILVLGTIYYANVASQSICPNVLTHDAEASQSGYWVGDIKITTDKIVRGMKIDIILDSPAEELGNWVGGDVTSSDDYTEFTFENDKKVYRPNQPRIVRFYIRYESDDVPNINTIRFNGRDICSAPPSAFDRISLNPEISSILDKFRSNHKDFNFDKIFDTDLKNGNRTYRNETTITYKVHPLANNNGSYSYITENKVVKINTEINNKTRTGNDNNAYKNPGTDNEYDIEESEFSVYERTPEVHLVPPITITNPRRMPDTPPPNRSVYNANNLYTTTTPQNSYVYSRTTTPTFLTRNRDETPDVDYSNDNKDYFEGGRNVFNIGSAHSPGRGTARINKCGKVGEQAETLILGGQPTKEGEWPWHVAIYHAQYIDHSKYICGGTLVSASHVLTAAHCVTRQNSVTPIDHQTLTVYLGKYNLRKSTETAQIMLVREIFVHPQFSRANFYADLAILKFTRPSEYTHFARPICLWKESEKSLNNIVDRDGIVVGWGIDERGTVSEELTLVRMPVVKQDTCLRSLRDFYVHFTSDKSYCAGYRNGSSVCNGDSGGGMVFSETEYNDDTPTWSLRGIVSISVTKKNEALCDSSHYVVFADTAQFLPWINEKIL